MCYEKKKWSSIVEEKNYLYSPQTLILLFIGLIALFGFALLAIEGGRVHMERIRAQSIADDAAAMMCSGGHDLMNQDDGFAILNNINDGANSIMVNRPPASGSYAGDLGYIEVVVNRVVRGGLTSLVYSDPIAVTGQTIASCTNQSVTVWSAELMQD
jgi:hypothetical protein